MTPPPNEYSLILTTCADAADADRLTAALLENRLAACVQRMPIQSAYHWQGAIQHEAELLLLIKTRRDLYPAVEERLRALHPYDVPEIIQLPITAGLPAYLNWISDNTRAP